MNRALLALVMVGALSLLAPAAVAQNPEERAARLSQRIMSPFCDGVTVHDCPSAESDELRVRIAGMARRGMSDAEIFDRLEAEYGPAIRATPEAGAAWVTPALAAFAGVALVVLLARRWTRPGDHEPESVPGHRISAADRARVQAELAAFKDEI